MKNTVLTVVVVMLARGAGATECGEARLQTARMKAAQAAEEQLKRPAGASEAKKALREAQSKLDHACAPRKVGIAALPLAYLVPPLGNLSRASLELSDDWGLTVTTRAGAAAGIVFDGPAELTVPSGLKWESELSPDRTAIDPLVAVATDAQLTVEEPVAGKGTWKIEVKNKPMVIALSKLRACAAGKAPDKNAGGLAPSVCRALLVADAVPGEASLPERGRALPLGEFQYGWHAALDLDGTSFAEAPEGSPAAAATTAGNSVQPRVELVLELSAPIPGVSDGKTLRVTLEVNKLARPAGVSFKLGNGCGDDDEKCELKRFGAEIYWDRVFGVPFLRAPRGPGGRLNGKVTDRLARPVPGQRMRASVGDRRIVTITDERGDYRFDPVPPGTAAVVPVGKDPHNALKGDETRTVQVGLGETRVPVTFVTKLWE